jgi:hypothetical protein
MKEEQPYVSGFVIIAMLIGEEPLSTDARKEAVFLQSPKPINTPIQMLKAYRAHARATKLGVPVSKLCSLNNGTTVAAIAPSNKVASPATPIALNAKPTAVAPQLVVLGAVGQSVGAAPVATPLLALSMMLA